MALLAIMETKSSLNHLPLFDVCQMCLCGVDISVASGSETGAYMIDLLLILLIVFSRDMPNLTRAERLVNSFSDIRREIQMFFFNPYIPWLINVNVSHFVVGVQVELLSVYKAFWSVLVLGWISLPLFSSLCQKKLPQNSG